MNKNYLTFVNGWKLIYKCSKKSFYACIFIVFLSGIIELSTISIVYPIIKYFTLDFNFSENLKILNNFQLSPNQLIPIAVIIILFSGIFRIFTVVFFNLLGARVSAENGYNMINSRFNTKGSPNRENYKASELIQIGRDYPVEMTRALLVPVLQIPQSLLVFAFILIYIISKTRLISLIMVSVIILSYILIFYFIQPFAYKLGKTYDKYNVDLAATLNNISKGWREIYTYSLQNKLISKYYEGISVLLKSRAILISTGGTPKLIIECFLISAALLTLLINKNTEGANSLVITLFALLKILPYVQTMYGALNVLSGFEYSLKRIKNELSLNGLEKQNFKKNINQEGKGIILNLMIDEKKKLKIIINYNLKVNILDREIKLNEDFLSQKELIIEKGKLCVITGPSGAGKSQLLDLIAGFYVENKYFSIKKDTLPSDNFIYDYSSYSTQKPFLFKGSLKQNIILDFESKVNNERLNKIIETLSLEDLVDRNEKFDPEIDSLSGGEAKRISIARALYSKDKPFVILDEPTGELDKKSSDKFFRYLPELLIDRTLILVTHNNKLPNWTQIHLEFK